MDKRFLGGAVPLLLIAMALLSVPSIANWLDAPDIVTLATEVAIFSIAAASLDFLIGYCGLASFGHAAFFGLGGYVVGIMATTTAAHGLIFGVFTPSSEAWIVWPLAVIVAAIAALAIGALSLRTTGAQFIMITLAFAEMLYYLFVSLKDYGGDDGIGFRRRNTIPFVNATDDTSFYYVCVLALICFLAIFHMIVRSRFGLALEAVRQNERRVLALGLPTYRYKLAAFVIAGAGAGLAGALNANLNRFVSPDLLHWTTSGDIMMMVVLGGIGSLFGSVFGATIMIVLQSYLAQWTEHWMIFFGPILVLVILFARRGVWGLASSLGRRFT